MPTLTWKDDRLPADDLAPWDTTVMLVSRTTPLTDLVADSKGWCEEQAGKGARNLMIYCHGSPGYLQLAKEGLTASNLKKLAPLKPYFDAVSIHACLVVKGRTGKVFCTRMALELVAPVDAAIELQYNTGSSTIYGWLDDKKYDGAYYRHNPSGEKVGPLRTP